MHRTRFVEENRAPGRSAPSFARWQERMLAAEQGEGWLAECVDADRYLAVTRELVAVLAKELACLANGGPVLEICAGSGELARCLATGEVDVVATDLAPTEESGVLCLSAKDALRRFQPRVVLGSFVPFDAGADEAVLACPSVQHYLVLNARVGGLLGSAALWQTSGWRAEPLDVVQAWMLTRHDVLMADFDATGASLAGLLQQGEAWHFTRIS